MVLFSFVVNLALSNYISGNRVHWPWAIPDSACDNICSCTVFLSQTALYWGVQWWTFPLLLDHLLSLFPMKGFHLWMSWLLRQGWCLTCMSFPCIRLNKTPPNMTFRRKEKGGINFTSTVANTHLDLDTVKAICSEYRIHNADVSLRFDATADDLIDVIEGSRIYMPCIYVVNKIDQITVEELDILDKLPHYCPIRWVFTWLLDVWFLLSIFPWPLKHFLLSVTCWQCTSGMEPWWTSGDGLGIPRFGQALHKTQRAEPRLRGSCDLIIQEENSGGLLQPNPQGHGETV